MYRAPVDEIAFTLNHVTGMKQALEAGRYGDLSADLVDAILAEAGRFAAEEIVPLAKIGDEQGAVWKDGEVTMPKGWGDLYRAWCEGGWNGLAAPEEHGGQGLPMTLLVATQEMWNSASMAFALCPTLTQGAIEAVEAHASEELKQKYLEKLVSGEWNGTMNLTEPQAGSDLNALTARAERSEDGSYRIFGQKIFITFGEHDMTDNIVHLVLARLPDAPKGTKGISLFLVPKYLVNDDGSIGARNDVFCASIEHKLGIHASPTCTMIYGDGRFGEEKGAIGWLVGEENRGLACMFTMMNNARLAVGMQGVAIAEAAYQRALAYAQERRQGRAPGASSEGMSPIVEHPDVARMLLTMKAMTQASRAITYSCAHAIDMARLSEGDEARHWQERANLLTPLAKAFPTDIGVEAASLGVQVHGGMGFIEETGAAVLYRDARIAPIYEGTNGIQAIDLVMRKLPQSGGDHVRGFIKELRETAERVRGANMAELADTGNLLIESLDHLQETTDFLMSQTGEGAMEKALSGATPYLRLFALAAGSTLLAGGAVSASDAKMASLTRYLAENHLRETAGLRQAVIDGGESLKAAASLFAA
ncbi:acyl-CoA dehydrogenase [Nitratireductor basaltis]|uniref:3-methylmercaptopropionyl-CoA dehydrogenase n=1 Tax=Nitratireductor basaltis TaxID=472175 RepID=A0A084UCU2_9HYPH|nr:acyl-CoA dehydrogenase [Nitratireductor basaltis]KFB10778.1 Acyl-CoA dehydrogenase-like protein [Nitratireductor basaltis]